VSGLTKGAEQIHPHMSFAKETCVWRRSDWLWANFTLNLSSSVGVRLKCVALCVAVSVAV